MRNSPPQLRIAVALGIACTIATALLFPYVLAIQPGSLAAASTAMHLPPWAVVVTQTLGNGFACFLLAWIGLKLGAPLGLGAPWLAAKLYGRAQPTSSAWLQASLLGTCAALLVLGLIALAGAPIDHASAAPPASLGFAFKGLLASPYGATTEEVQVRVFLMGFLAWLPSRLAGMRAKPWIMPAAIVLAALLFGAGHLPLAAKLVSLTLDVVVRVITYNALPGLLFGWLYWRCGLEHAMLAHLCADLVLHVAAPLLA